MFRSFFYNSKGEFNPVYFWITCFCLVALVLMLLRVFGANTFSDALVLGVLGFIQIWVALYNKQSKDKREIG